jgi:hypothetical protein
VQTAIAKTSYFGFSFGGIITANLANRYVALKLPSRGQSSRRPTRRRPRERGSRRSMTPCRASRRRCETGVPFGAARRHRPAGHGGRSCIALVPDARHIPKKNKEPRAHAHRHSRRSALAVAARAVRGADRGSPTPTTGTSAGRCGTRCGAAAVTRGRTAATPAAVIRRQHRSMGGGATGVAITPLKIQDAAADPALTQERTARERGIPTR